MEDLQATSESADAERPGMWMVPVSLGERLAMFSWRMGVASAFTGWLVYLQFQSGAPYPYMLWGFAIFAVGTYYGVRAINKRERRVFDSVEIRYTHSQRFKRAWRWLAVGFVMLTIVWWVQISKDQFTTYWWYAWPCLIPLLVGVGLYLLKGETVLTGAGQYARAQLEKSRAKVTEERKAKIVAILESGPARYAGAAGCLYGAYWLLSASSTGKDASWAAFAFVVFAFILARELGLWLLGAGALCLVAWAVFAGLAALPVSAAIIIGALIIASASGKR